MKPKSLRYPLFVVLLLSSFVRCGHSQTTDDYLLRFTNPAGDEPGYRNGRGDTTIRPGTYLVCFTDTFRTYALVAHPRRGLVAIDRQQTVLYNVFPFDNGPDAPADGRFRIVADGKIGFADATTGAVVIPPRFGCAYPFERGRAKVSTNCRTESDGEHRTWLGDDWYFIDRTGGRLATAKE